MKMYHGILVDKSLTNQGIISNLKVIGKKKSGSWTLLKIEIGEKNLDKTVKLLQKYMSDGKFYFHVYGNDEIIAVFKNRIFKMKCTNVPKERSYALADKSTWKDAIEYGKAIGIPEKQLDFYPFRFEDEEF